MMSDIVATSGGTDLGCLPELLMRYPQLSVVQSPSHNAGDTFHGDRSTIARCDICAVSLAVSEYESLPCAQCHGKSSAVKLCRTLCIERIRAAKGKAWIEPRNHRDERWTVKYWTRA